MHCNDVHPTDINIWSIACIDASMIIIDGSRLKIELDMYHLCNRLNIHGEHVSYRFDALELHIMKLFSSI